MTLLYIPILAAAFLAGVTSLYLLTQTRDSINAIVPVLAGLSLMVGLAGWYCTDGSEKNRVLKWRRVFETWFGRSLCFTALAIPLGLVWFVLSDRLNWYQGLAECYVIASVLIVGCMVLRTSNAKQSWSWGLLLAGLLSIIVYFHVRDRSVPSANICWTEFTFKAYWYGWLAVCALNLLFWLASGACLLAVKKDFLEHARGLWTACISGTVPMAMCAVVHIGVFAGLCLFFGVSNHDVQAQAPFNLLNPFSAARIDCSSFGYETLKTALNDWQKFTCNPAIQYGYLFIILAGALALCAVLPSVTSEINARLRACTDKAVSKSLGDATSQMFDLLRLCGEIIQRYVVIAIPIVVWHASRLTKTAPHIPTIECWIGMGVLGAAFVGLYTYQEFKAETRSKHPAGLGAKVWMFVARILIVLACVALPWSRTIFF